MSNSNGYNNGHKTQAAADMAQILPPHSKEAEDALIGCLLIDPDALAIVAADLRPDDFYTSRAKLAYACTLDLFDKREPVDLMTLPQAMKLQGDDDSDIFCIQAINLVPSALNVASYAKIISDLSTRRRMIQAAQTVAKLAYQTDGDINTQLDEAETAVMGARGERSRQGVSKPRDYTTEYLAELEAARDGRKTVGLPTGFNDLDKLLVGLEAPYQYILAGRPGMGKSAAAVNIAWHLANRHGKRVAFFALEMSEKQIVNRIVSAETRIDNQRLRQPQQLSASELALVYEAVGKVSDTRLFIDATPGQSPAQLRAKCLRLYAEHGLDLVIIDHMHLMVPDRRMNRPDLEYGEISQSLRDLGKLVNAPVLTLAQLSRSVEARQNKRPLLSDLRESGRIEENAYAVMFLYRDDYYNELSDAPNQAELIVAKNRDGNTGTIRLYWSGKTTTFSGFQARSIEL